MTTHSHKHIDGTVTENCPCIDLDALAMSLQDELDREERRHSRSQAEPSTYRSAHWKGFAFIQEIDDAPAHVEEVPARERRKEADLLGQSNEWLWFSALLLVLCSIAAWVNW